jgi:hypothetical protein
MIYVWNSKISALFHNPLITTYETTMIRMELRVCVVSIIIIARGAE